MAILPAHGAALVGQGAETAVETGLLERHFKLRERGTNTRTEVLAGVTTFLAMAYIVLVNPAILGQAGMPVASVAPTVRLQMPSTLRPLGAAQALCRRRGARRRAPPALPPPPFLPHYCGVDCWPQHGVEPSKAPSRTAVSSARTRKVEPATQTPFRPTLEPGSP